MFIILRFVFNINNTNKAIKQIRKTSQLQTAKAGNQVNHSKSSNNNKHIRNWEYE